MRILFIADIVDWSYFEQILSEERPDLLLIGGDIFQIENNAVNEKLQRILFGDVSRRVDQHVRMTEFLHNVSIVRFYSTLQYAARQCQVFVVRGDHDLKDLYNTTYTFFDSSPYDVNKINAIDNCKEVSGKNAFFDGFKLLGLGYLESHSLKTLRSIAASQKSPPDIILAHSENRRREMICNLFKPKLFVTGHCGFGKRKLNNTWIVECDGFPWNYAIIRMDAHAVSEIALKHLCRDKNQSVEERVFHCSERGSCYKCRSAPNHKVKDRTLVELAYYLERVFPTMVELCKNNPSFIRIMGKIKVTKKGVVEGKGSAAERAQKIYERFMKERIRACIEP